MLLRFCCVILICAGISACGGGGGSGSGGNPDTPLPFSEVPTSELQKSSHFLSQAGFGGPLSEIEEVATKGEAAWLAEQLEMQPSLHAQLSLELYNEYCTTINTDPLQCVPDATDPIFRDFVLINRVVNAPDQVQQKVAYALSQIFVTSGVPDTLNDLEALSYWWDLLLTYGLTNYRDLLEAVTLSPTMGVYLSHYRNSKGDPANGVFPDENYAREVMQLFSIGLYELNPDGSRKKDGNGNDIPTYTNAEIREFARVFTGLANGCGDNQQFEFFFPVAFVCPMKMYEEHHATGSKNLLNGFTAPDGQAGMEDISDALDNLYNHPNVGPFIGRLLIQRLVMSNPSPQYIARVTAAFNDNGAGVRGDMKAVVSAILLDPEARVRTETSGKVREPFLRFAHLLRALELNSSTGNYYYDVWFLENILKQFPLRSPSVFNFYSPNHVPFGEAGDLGLFAPELQITNSFTVPEYFVQVQAQVVWGSPQTVVWDSPQTREAVNEALELNYSKLAAYEHSPVTVAEYLDVLFTHGTMTDITRKGIRDILNALSDDPELVPGFAIHVATFFAMVSPEYIVRQ